MTWFRLSQARFATAALMVSLTIAGCGGTNETSADETSAGPDQSDSATQATDTDITVQFTWKVKGEYAALFVADAKGHFADAGLNVEFVEGTGSQSTLARVGNEGGDNTFVIAPMNQMAAAVGEGFPFISVATWQPKVGSVLVSHPDVPLKQPQDLEGQRVGLNSDSNASLIFDAFLAKNDVDVSEVDVVTFDPGALHPAFLSGDRTVIDAFTTADVPLLEQEGEGELNLMYFADWGFPALGSGAAVTQEFAEAKPDVISRFLEAVGKGVEAIKENPQEAAEIMKERYPTGLPDLEATVGQVQATADSIVVEEGHQYGWSSAEEWDAMTQTLEETSVIDEALPSDRYFTNEFLD